MKWEKQRNRLTEARRRAKGENKADREEERKGRKDR